MRFVTIWAFVALLLISWAGISEGGKVIEGTGAGKTVKEIASKFEGAETEESKTGVEGIDRTEKTGALQSVMSIAKRYAGAIGHEGINKGTAASKTKISFAGRYEGAFSEENNVNSPEVVAASATLASSEVLEHAASKGEKIEADDAISKLFEEAGESCYSVLRKVLGYTE